MKANSAPKCVELRSWLKANLGSNCLAPLTGTDDLALSAATHVLDLYQRGDGSPSLLQAFGVVVSSMQPSTREMAYHAIAYIAQWSCREQIWKEAGLPKILTPRVCRFEPKTG